MSWWKKSKGEAAEPTGYDQGFWEYVEKASDEVSGWSDWKREGWSLVQESEVVVRNSHSSDFEETRDEDS